MLVEIFKTNIQKKEEAVLILEKLNRCFPGCVINFDLEDCDKVLRIEGHQFSPGEIIEILSENNYQCEILKE